LASEDRITRNTFNAIISKINTLRINEGFNPLGVAELSAVQLNAVMKGQDVARLRKALRLEDTLHCRKFIISMNRQDFPYGTLVFQDTYSGNPQLPFMRHGYAPPLGEGMLGIGKPDSVGFGGLVDRFRMCMTVWIPDYGRTITSATMLLKVGYFGFVENHEGYLAEIWRSNTDDYAFANGDPYNFDNLEGYMDETNLTTEQSIPLNLAAVQARMNGHISYIFCTDKERTGTGSAGPDDNYYSLRDTRIDLGY
jgi:hypothetical protein